MLTREEVFEQVKKVVVESLGVDASEVTEAADFSNDLGADSLDSVELIMSLEDLGVSIPEADAEGLKTVGQAVDYILAHKS
jgi:acyl carrier protein